MVLLLLTLIGSVVTCGVVLDGSPSGAMHRLAALPSAALVVLAGCSFQVTHFVEHGLQVVYWLAHPTAAPWLTPWASAAADSMSPSPLGVELLHLVGNGIFLVSALALVLVTAGLPGRQRWARWCVIVQGLHVTEHVALTMSVAVGGQAIGVSTLFGMLAPAPSAWTYRIVLHFGVNLVATLLAMRSIRGLARDEQPATTDAIYM